MKRTTKRIVTLGLVFGALMFGREMGHYQGRIYHHERTMDLLNRMKRVGNDYIERKDATEEERLKNKLILRGIERVIENFEEMSMNERYYDLKGEVERYGR